MAEETDMKTRLTTKLVREGDLVAEVELYLVEGDAGWAPYARAANVLRAGA